MSDNKKTAKFYASLPDIQSAIKAGGDGMRVQFDIPESEMAESIKLMLMKGELLEVEVKVVSGKKVGRAL